MSKATDRPTLSSVLADVYFTPTEAAIVRVLGDGLPHSVKELILLLNDEMASKSTLMTHISNVRKKIAVYGHDIVHTLELRRTNYRYVISLKHHVKCEYS